MIAKQTAISYALASVLLVPATAFAQTPLSSAFTYQGQLKLAGEPLKDTADFEFTLWDAETGGNTIGAAWPVNNVTVVDGLFIVPLDFGVEVFNGDARWLEIAVRSPAGSGEFTTLTPRQPLTAAPYALQTRGMYCDAAGKIGIGNTAPQHLLSVGGNTVDWQTVGIRSYGDNGGAWQGAAAFGYDSATVIVGELYDVATIGGHSSDLGAWADLAINPAGGNVGIGTDAPGEKLTVAGVVESTSGGFKFPDGSVQATASGAGLWSITGSDIYYTAGNVSIGTTTPLVDGLTVSRAVQAHRFLGNGSGLWCEECIDDGTGLDCQESTRVELGLLEEQLRRLRAVTDPGPPVEFVDIDLEKRWRQPRLTPESFDVHVALTEGSGVHTFSVSPESPVYNTKSDPLYQGTFHVRVHLVSATRLEVVFDHQLGHQLEVKRVGFQSPGYIMDAHVEPYAPGSSEVQLSVRIKNDGDLKADYVVTVTDCDFDVAPIVHQIRVLEAQQEMDLTFDPRRSGGTFIGGETCKVSMFSSLGKQYDYVWVTFPLPTAAGGGGAAHSVTVGAAPRAVSDEGACSKEADVAELRADNAELRDRLDQLEAMVAELTKAQ